MYGYKGKGYGMVSRENINEKNIWKSLNIVQILNRMFAVLHIIIHLYLYDPSHFSKEDTEKVLLFLSDKWNKKTAGICI